MELVDLKKYFDLVICTEQVYKGNNLKEDELIRRVSEYFDNIIDSFNGLEIAVNELISNNQISRAIDIINERFSDESLNEDLMQTSNKFIYLNVFKELKELFALLISNYNVEENKNDYLNKINTVLSSLHLLKKDTIYNLKKVNRSYFNVYVSSYMSNVRKRIPDNLLDLFDNIEDLVQLVSKSQENVLDFAYLRGNIFRKFSFNIDFKSFGFSNNNLSCFVMKNIRNKKNIYFYDGVDCKIVYNNFCTLMFEFIDDNILSVKGRKYYKKMFSKNINNYLLLGEGSLTINIDNFFRFLNEISFATIIDELTPDTESCYDKLDLDYFNKFCRIIKNINGMNLKEDHFKSLSVCYDEELSNLKNDDLSVLKLFIKK